MNTNRSAKFHPILGTDFNRASKIKRNFGKALINLNDLKILRVHRTDKAPEVGRRAAATITKSKIFQPLLKNLKSKAYIFSDISITKTANIILSIKEEHFRSSLLNNLKFLIRL